MIERRSVTEPQVPDRVAPAAESGRQAALRYPGPGRLFILWTVVGILSSLRFQFQRPSNPEIGQLGFTLAFIACYYPWIALTPLVFRIEKRFPLGSGNWPLNVGILSIISVPVCLLASPVMVGLFTAVLSAMEPAGTLRGRPNLLSHFPFAEVIFWSSVAGGYFIRTLNQLREQEQKAARLALEKSQLEAGLKQAQLDVLRARLNPHFLFNSLQNISVMTKQDPQTASRMLTRLGDLLRAALRQDSEPESTLRDEIDLTRTYVSMEQMRFGDRLEVKFSVAPEVRMAMVPCFILQPLIENAVIHGLRGVRKTGVIAVTAARAGQDLVLTITDNGIGLPDEDLSKMKIGIGVGSTRERLSTMYPDRHTFTMRRPPEGGTEVRIVVPLRLAEFEEGASPDEQPAVADR